MRPPSLFGTSGIRGDARKLFTNQFCFDLGRTFARFLTIHKQSGPVAIGMDPRGSSPRIAQAVQTGLAFEKRQILDQGGCPIPAVNYSLIATSAIGGVMITGSHIAPHLNGIKFFAFNEEILKKHEAEIEKMYYKLKRKVAYAAGEIKDIEDPRGKREYEEMLVNLAGQLPSWKIVVDPGNGAQSGLISRVLARLGCEVIPLNDHLQGEFMSRDTETEDSFYELQKKVVVHKAVIGIGFDADGDRAAFVDEKGKYLPGDYIGALLAREAKGDTIVTPINTSTVVEKIGKKVVRTKVGSPHVVAAIKKHGASFGFEGNGGGIHAEIMLSRDGGATAIKLLKLLASSAKKLSRLVDELPRYSVSKKKIDCPTGLNKTVLRAVRQKYRRSKIEDKDGLKVRIDDSAWILFRPSSNSPEFRVFAEAKKKEEANALAAEGLTLVSKVIATA